MKIIFIFLMILIPVAVFAWLFRFDVTINNVGVVIVTDRWMGKVYYCGSSDCQLVYPKGHD
jgi:hypothetical protein